MDMDVDVELCPGAGMERGVSLAIQEALRSQQQLLQNLYMELDDEREASATAVSEALSMILRLQGEKAAVKMEADQYRRVAEERMCHAERSVEVFEDVVRQKDMEIASLEFQVLAYRYKLMSLGCGGDHAVGENSFLEDLFSQRFDLYGWGGKESGGANVRRMNSLSPQCSKDLHRRKDDNFLENRLGNSVKGDLIPSQKPIKMMGGRVEELSDRYNSRCHPVISSMSKPDDAVTKKEAPRNSASASSIHDVFEVPGIEGSCKGLGAAMRNGCLMPWNDGDDDRLGKPDLDPEASGWIKEMLASLNNDKVHDKSKEITTCANDATLQEVRDMEIRDEVRALSDRVNRLEKERNAGVEGIVCEQLIILKEIREHMKGEMKLERLKNETRRQGHRQQSILPLQEAMIHFWF